MDATRRQRALRALVTMILGFGLGIVASLDPAAAIRNVPFMALGAAMCIWTVAENLVLLQDEPRDYAHKRQTRIMQGAVMLAVFLGVIDLFHLPFARPGLLTLVGLACIAAGAIVRIAAIRTLARHFSYELRIERDHELVQSGLYGILRHPSYLGILLITIGAALTVGSWLAAIVAGAVMIGVIVWRVSSEETMLRASFGPRYEEYAKRTWRIVPFVY